MKLKTTASRFIEPRPLREWLLYAIIALLFIVIGFLVWYVYLIPSDEKLQQDAVSMRRQISLLQSELAGLEIVAQGTTTTTPAFTQKIQLSDELQNAGAVAFCGERKANDEAPDQWVDVQDPRTHVAFTVPYNENWGYELCSLSPLEAQRIENEASSTLSLLGFGHFTWPERQYRLLIAKPITEPELRADIAKWGEGELGAGTLGPIQTRNISGLTVLDYQLTTSPYPAHAWDVLGQTYLYRFSTFASQDATIQAADEEVLKVIETLQTSETTQ